MKHIPERMCLCCRNVFDKKDLIRIVKSGDTVFVDETKSKNGRGAYICKSPDCLKKLIKSKGLDRAFKMTVDASIYEQVEKIINGDS